MPPVGFEPTISAGELPQTHALDRAATGTGIRMNVPVLNTYSTYIFVSLLTHLGCAVAQLVETLSYKPEGRGFDSLT